MPEIRYGNQTLQFEVRFTERKTLEISVLPDQSVQVKAPRGKSLVEVTQRVKRRAGWIVKQQAYFAQYSQAAPAKAYVSGETFRYLGRQYRLKVIDLSETAASPEGAQTQETVKLSGRYFQVYTRQKDNPDHTRQLLEKWYRAHATAKFTERLEQCARVMQKYGIERPPLEIRAMKNRWGSCTPSGKILLNPRLIETPTYCIDYVILHELCHLKHPHHGKAFYELLSLVLPEWERVKGRLEKESRD